MSLKQDFLEDMKKRHQDILERVKKFQEVKGEAPTKETPKKAKKKEE